jgi:hypothetical protein
MNYAKEKIGKRERSLATRTLEYAALPAKKPTTNKVLDALI